MASIVQHRARSRKRAEYLVSTKTLAEELVRALSAAADNEQRWALTTAGHVALESAAV
jgi:hypothetical protein